MLAGECVCVGELGKCVCTCMVCFGVYKCVYIQECMMLCLCLYIDMHLFTSKHFECLYKYVRVLKIQKHLLACEV